MIKYFTPWNSNKDLAQEYHECMAKLSDNEYAVFTDGDTTFTTDDYGAIIEQVIQKNPDVHFFTGRTNRVATHWQRYELHKDPNDIEYHRAIGREIADLNGTEVKDCTNQSLWSGFFMVIKKESWHGIKLRSGMLGVDNDIHEHARKIGQKVYLMLGVYLYHWYSNFSGSNGNVHRDKSHLI